MLLVFPRPLSVLAGFGPLRHICGAGDAIAFLEQANLTGDEAFEVTLDVCRRALRGETTAEEAFDVFAAFARRRGILAEEDGAGELAAA